MPRTLADLVGTNSNTFRLGKPPTRATFDASGLTEPRALTVQDASGTLALVADVAAAQAAAIAYAIQRTNHTGTQLAATIGDFAAAALAATSAAYQPLNSGLTAIAALTTTAYGRGALTLADAPAFASYAGIPLLATSAITGVLTLSKAGTTARTATFPDAAITVAGIELAQTFSALQEIAVSSDVDSVGALSVLRNTAATTGTIQGARTVVAPSPLSASSAIFEGARFATETSGGQNFSSAFYGLRSFVARLRHSGTGTVTSAAGMLTDCAVTSGAVTSIEQIRIGTLGISGGGSVGTLYGLCIGNQTGAVTNYAISTGTGLVTIGDTTDATTTSNGSVRLSGGLSVAKAIVSGSTLLVGIGTSGNGLTVHHAMGQIGVNTYAGSLPSAGARIAMWAFGATAANTARAAITSFATENWTSGGVSGCDLRFEAVAIGGTSSRTTVMQLSAAQISCNVTTDATTTSNGSVRLSGGLSVAKSCVIGGTAGNFLNIANATGELRVNGTKVLGARGAAVADASGGIVIDAEARTAINTLLARMRAHGSIAT